MSDNTFQFLPIEEMQVEFVISALSETMDWGLTAAGIPDAHKITRGTGIKVAVLDTGYATHDDLKANVIAQIDCTSSGASTDHQGHGTHVSGIIAAAANGIGIIGVAPEAQIIAIKVLDDSGRGGFDAIEAGIRAAIAQGADIINMSLGVAAQAPDSLHDAVKEAYDKGIIIVAAAGNDKGAVNFPARYPEVIAVAAMDQKGNMASFSSRGEQVAVGAPGVNIYSTFLNNGYAVLNGTSQASPFIAGVCALTLAYTRANPDKPQIHNAVDMLKALALLCDPSGRIVSGKSGDFGYGVPKFANVDWTKV